MRTSRRYFKDGMGGRGDREDWVADIPIGCASVHNYMFRKPYFGFDIYKSFNDAIVGQMKRTRNNMLERLSCLRKTIAAGEKTVAALSGAIKRSQKHTQ